VLYLPFEKGRISTKFILKTLPVDCGEVTPVEWGLSHDEAGSPSL